MLKVAFLVRSLAVGGAERQLSVLARALRGRGHCVEVWIFYSENERAEKELIDAGVSVALVERRGRFDFARQMVTLNRLYRDRRPDVVYSFLSLGNIFSGLLKPSAPQLKVVWGIRASNVDMLLRASLGARVSYGIERLLSRLPDLVIANSHAGATYVANRGFRSRITVVANGIDSELYARDSNARARLRQEWGVNDHNCVVAIIGRLDPLKDHTTFFRAASIVSAHRPSVSYLCVEGGSDAAYLGSVKRLCADLGLDEKTIWLGPQSNMPALYSAVDVVVSTSVTEGFSNVIAEAMACEVPCVVTDVGDSAMIVGSTGFVVPAGSPQKSAAAIEECLNADRTALGKAARKRIVEKFSISELVEHTERTLIELVSESRRTPSAAALRP